MPIPSRAHDYGLNDMVSLFNDALYGNNGILPNLSFMPPMDPSEYDNIAWQSRLNQQELFRQFIGQTVGQTANRRAAAISSALGLGRAGMAVFNGAMRLDPRSALSVIGHHGGAEAVRNILSMGNSMAYARGTQLGGVLDPTTLVQNTNFAAIQGGMAYANNFNLDGSINAEQTRGLNLQTAGYVIGRTLSDSSSYASWASRLRRGEGLTAAERMLTENDIRAFTNGEKMDPRKFEAASNSFNEDIKKMTRELNGLIASVSKMTGSCDEAIRFLDNYTNGNLTSATESAKQARSRAARIAANIRVTAADSGISPEHLYGMAIGTQAKTAYSMFQNDPRAILFGASRMFDGSTGALAFGDWASRNQGATGEQSALAEQLFSLKDQDYYNSGASRLNALAGRLMATKPDLNWDEYKSRLQSGDTIGAQRWLEAHSSKSLVNRALTDDRWVAMMRSNSQYQGNIFDLDASAKAGQSKEANRYAEYRQVMENEEFHRETAAGNNAERLEKLGDPRKLHRKQLLSDEVLMATGYSKSELKSVREELSQYADNETIMDKLMEKGGESPLRMSYQMLQAETSRRLNAIDKIEAENYRKDVDRISFDSVTEDDRRQARRELALERERDAVDSVKAAAISGDRSAMDQLLKKGGNKFSGAILDKMNASISEQLATVGGKTSPESIRLSKKEMDDVKKRVLTEMADPENKRTLEDVSRDVLRDKYSEHLLNTGNHLDNLELFDANGNISEKAMQAFGETFSKNFKSEVLGYQGFIGKDPSKAYLDKITDKEAENYASGKKRASNRELSADRMFNAGGTVGEGLQWRQDAILDAGTSFKAAVERLGASGKGKLAEVVASDSDLSAAKDSAEMPLSSANTIDFQKLTDDIGNRTRLVNSLEYELNKKGGKWKEDLKKAVADGDEKSLNKIFGDNTSFKSLKDLGMSALEAGKIMSAGLDAKDGSKKEIAIQDAILDQRLAHGAGPHDDVAQILLKILNLMQSAVK